MGPCWRLLPCMWGKKPPGPPPDEEGEYPELPGGELRLVMSGFISGGEGILLAMLLTLGMGLSIVTAVDSMESEERRLMMSMRYNFKQCSHKPVRIPL